MKTYIAIFVLISNFQLGTAQDFEFGKISKEELTESFNPKDSSVNATILYNKQYTYIESTNNVNTLITNVQKRIKFYNQDGFDHATVLINLYKGQRDKESVRKIKAYTFNLENEKIVKTKLDKDQIFENEVSHNYEQVKFTMPNVQEGSVIEFQYQKRSPYIWNIDEFKFQYDIPVKIVEAELRTPKGFKFRPSQKGYISIYPEYSQEMDHRTGMMVDIKKFNLENVPALKEENYVDNINNYRAGLMFELISIELPQFFKSYAHSWSDVAATIGSSDDYERQLDKSNSFDEEVELILEDVSKSQIDRLKAIFAYVKENIKWNGIDGKNFYNGIKKTLKEKTGNVADLNLLLVAMLRFADIDANPVVISTKDNLIPFFPTVDRLNYVIALAEIEGKRYFMDATDEFSDINLLPIKDYNWQGLYINNNKKVWQKVSIAQPEKSQSLRMLNIELNEDGEIDGSVKSRFVNHAAYNYRNEFKNADEDAYIANLESQFDNIEISDFSNKNTSGYHGHVSESFNFHSDDLTEKVSDKIYFKPLLFLGMVSNPFKQEERLYPIDFGTSNLHNYNFIIKIPENYKVESIPKNIAAKLPENLGEFRFHSKVAKNNISLQVEFEITKPIVQAKNYNLLKEFFQFMINKEAEQVVLSKA